MSFVAQGLLELSQKNIIPYIAFLFQIFKVYSIAKIKPSNDLSMWQRSIPLRYFYLEFSVDICPNTCTVKNDIFDAITVLVIRSDYQYIHVILTVIIIVLKIFVYKLT